MPVRAFYDLVWGTGWTVQPARGVLGPRCEKWIVVSLDGRRILHDGVRRSPGTDPGRGLHPEDPYD